MVKLNKQQKKAKIAKSDRVLFKKMIANFITFLFFTLIFSQFTYSQNPLLVEIKVNPSFSEGETVSFDYTISNGDKNPISITYTAGYICPSLILPPLETNTHMLDSLPLSKHYIGPDIKSETEPQDCMAVVSIIKPYYLSFTSKFQILSKPSFEFIALSDSKVYTLSDAIYLNYESKVQSPTVLATLIFPDGKENSIILPYTFQPTAIGVYTIKATAEKLGYKQMSSQTQFSVIDSKPVIKSETLCNGNNLCQGNENYQNCPLDCPRPEQLAPPRELIQQRIAMLEQSQKENQATSQNTQPDSNKPTQTGAVLPSSVDNQKVFTYQTKKESPISNMLIFSVLITLAISLSGYLVLENLRKKHSPNKLHDIASQHDVHTVHIETQKLVEFIKTARKYKFSDDDIKAKLASIGWKGKDVENAFKDANK